MRTRIDYGIYFNNDFCQIARMENGMPVIKRSDTMKESMPLCVHFNKRGDILIGDTAFIVLKNDQTKGLKLFDKGKTNTFNQFTRTLGTNHTYESSNTGKSYTGEELLAECFKKLKSFVQDEDVRTVVITVPAKFLNPQNEAVSNAGKLAGFEQIELIQKPIAALTGYGLGTISNGFYLLFDFQSEFNVSLCKFKEGIISIIDTEGDNWLGDNNITEAIVDEIIIPYLRDNYALDSILNDPISKIILVNAIKHYAEDTKIQMSSKDKHSILSQIGDLPFEDENGEEPEIDIEITQQDLAWVSRPIFQKAIDITIDLLKRNNLKGKNLHSICLVGEGTYSPILRRMLKEQITDKVDTSVDPMTAVVKGAALFASTILVSNEVRETTIDKTKVQLDIKYEARTVELDELVCIKVVNDNKQGELSGKIYAEIVRKDGNWASGKKLIGVKAIIIDVLLVEDTLNTYIVNTSDDKGNKLECEPNQFNIIHSYEGYPIVLPYHIGIARYFESEGKELFQTIKGLEKNKQLPATGVINGFKTQFDLRPGVSSDVIRFPIYQGDYNAAGTNPLLNNHVCDILISGETLPALLPAGSDIDITIKVDTSQLLTISAYIPYLNHTEEVEIEIRQTEPVTLRTIDDLKGELVLFYSDNPAMGKERFRFLLGELIRIEKNGISDIEKLKVVDSVKKEILKWT
ncbi:MAG TPA: Hsp70 family protein [Saprospiraceae bacterium]|nr:Hsp70 family protein [Saprospiraceae bacterium]